MALSATLVLCSAQLQVGTARALDSRRLRELLQVRQGATCVNVESLAAYIEPWLEQDMRLEDVSIVVEGSPTDPREASFRVLRAQQTVAHRAFRPGPAIDVSADGTLAGDPECQHVSLPTRLRRSRFLRQQRRGYGRQRES
jgi:hypothetical protein